MNKEIELKPIDLIEIKMRKGTATGADIARWKILASEKLGKPKRKEELKDIYF